MKKWQYGEKGKILVGALVCILMGLWYGPHWNLALCGLLIGGFLLLERKVLARRLRRLPGFVCHLYALAVVYLSCILFRCTQLSDLGRVLKGMFGFNGRGFTSMEVNATIGANILFLLVVIGLCTPLFKYIYEWGKHKFRHRQAVRNLYGVMEMAGPAVLLVIAMVSLIGNHFYSVFYF